MQLILKLLDGRYKTITVRPTNSVMQILSILEKEEGYPIPRIRLVCGGQQLYENRPISDYVTKCWSINVFGKLCTRVHVKWEGKRWITKKDGDFKCFLNDLHELSDTGRDINGLTGQHLKQVIAKHLSIQPSQFDIYTLSREPGTHMPVGESQLLTEFFNSLGCDFAVEFRV